MLNFLLGRSSFHDKETVIESVKLFDRFSDCENTNQASALLIFKSDTQQCWLVFTDHRMYFVVDDSEKQLLKAMWARDRDKLVTGERINLHLKETNHSNTTGKLFFGNMNNSILYTYSLFQGMGISGSIMSLANQHFLNNS